LPKIFKSIGFDYTLVIWTDGYQGVRNPKIERTKCYPGAVEYR
jgi:hypothetical protein